jgi:hypothetical protein
VIAATSIADLRALAGRELGASDWLEVTPEDVNALKPVCVAEFLIRVFEKED